MLALDFSVSRDKQDDYGMLSHRRASAAQRQGRFRCEILPLQATVLSDPANSSGGRVSILVDKDDGIRHDLTPETMRAARPAFKGFGDERSTGPNSSQVTDGAAMAILMKRRLAHQLGLEIAATHIGNSVVGVRPSVMGIGPVEAIR